MNGYEFVREVLVRTDNDVGELIELAHGRETEWLEFKAGTGPEGGICDKGTNKGDYRFDVARALFALANGIGGALLIGIKETKERDEGVIAVDLHDSGFEGDKGKFLESLWDQVLVPAKVWRAAKQGHWQYTGGWHGLFSLKWGTFLGEQIVIVLVRPCNPDGTYLELTCTDPRKPSFVPVRLPGECGRTEKFDRQRADQWWKARELDRPELAHRFASFDVDWARRTAGPAPCARSAPDVFVSAIQKYIGECRTQVGELRALFTPLDAEELAVPGQFESEVIERLGDEVHAGDGGSTSPSRARRGGILGFLSQERRALVLGESGSGKSTCLKQRALALTEGWTPGRAWAMTVPLFAYTRAGLRKLLLEQLPGLGWADIEPGIGTGEISLLLDGLNECPPAFLEACYDDMDGLLRQYPAARIVVSSRQSHWPRGLGLPAFEMLPMNRDQQRRFISAHSPDEAKADAILEQVYRKPGAEFIASSPILLRILAELDLGDGELLDGRAKLYRSFFDAWYRREQARYNSGRLPGSLDDMRAALALLAFRMRAQGLVSCSRRFAERTVGALLGDGTGRLLDAVSQGPFLLQHAAGQSLRFAHETIQDYLAAEHIAAHPGVLKKDLLADASAIRSRAWAMPLVLVFELLADPPDQLLEVAWGYEPLLVAAALRESERLASLPVPGDPWLRMVLHALRGEDTAQDSSDMVYASRVPPKYPLPGVLENALRGSPFWYAGLSHPQGAERLERLQELLCAGEYPWLELVPAACAGHPALAARLGPARRLLAGDDVDDSSALGKASIAELCVLLRLKKISPGNVLIRWKSALRRGDDSLMERDLICLLSSDKLFGNEFSPAGEMVNGYKEHLIRIAANRKLSLRLLNVLVRLKVITPAKIRKDLTWIDDIVQHSSLMNVVRFLKSGVLQWKDLSEERAQAFLWQLSPQKLKELELFRLVPQGAVTSELRKPDSLREAQRQSTGRHLAGPPAR